MNVILLKMRIMRNMVMVHPRTTTNILILTRATKNVIGTIARSTVNRTTTESTIKGTEKENSSTILKWITNSIKRLMNSYGRNAQYNPHIRNVAI